MMAVLQNGYIPVRLNAEIRFSGVNAFKQGLDVSSETLYFVMLIPGLL